MFYFISNGELAVAGSAELLLGGPCGKAIIVIQWHLPSVVIALFV